MIESVRTRLAETVWNSTVATATAAPTVTSPANLVALSVRMNPDPTPLRPWNIQISDTRDSNPTSPVSRTVGGPPDRLVSPPANVLSMRRLPVEEDEEDERAEHPRMTLTGIS